MGICYLQFRDGTGVEKQNLELHIWFKAASLQKTMFKSTDL